MLFIPKAKVPKYLTLPRTTSVSILSHTTNNGVTTFTYTIPIKVDTAAVMNLDGDLQLRVFSSRKKPEKLTIKTSTISSSNILKSIDRQKIAQASNRDLTKKFFFEKFIDRPDLSSSSIDVMIDVNTSQVADKFSIEAVNRKQNGQILVFDSVEIDHTKALQIYDLPSQDFLLTTTRNKGKTVYASASTSDHNTGYFGFLFRNEAGSTFEPAQFTTKKLQPVDHSGVATVSFDVPDSDQLYTIRAYPVSTLLKQEAGNFKQETAAFVKNVKQMSFYMSELLNDSVTFKIANINNFIKKIFLYRRSSLSHDREFVSAVTNTAESITITDKSRQPQYDYIYSVDYVDQDGNTKTCPTDVIVLSLKLDTLAKLSVSQTSLTGSTNTETNLSFNVSIDYDTTTLYDQLYSDVKSLGVESIFSTDLSKMTNNLKPITRVLVSRISLVTGVETDVGVYPPGVVNIQNLETGPCIFRFEVAVRSVPEALESLTAAQNVIADGSFNQKSTVDLTSKLIGNLSKTARTSFSSKFFSKSSLRDSTIKYGNSASLSDIGYFAGRTGIFYDIMIAPRSNNSVVIRNTSVLTTNKGNFLQWNATGDLKNIDYFSIVADENTFKSHPIQKSLQIFHIGEKNPRNVIVTPVFLDARNKSDGKLAGG